jgi:hypothetical protein
MIISLLKILEKLMQRVFAILSARKEKSIVTAWASSALLALLFCLVMLSRPAAAQTGQQFVGHVQDSSHASIAGATVTLHNEGTGEEIVVKTTGAGDYTIPYLKAGTYTITAEKGGFKAVSKTHVELHTDQSSKIDFALPVGDITETVTVSGGGAQIELSKADRGEIIDAERVQEMPTDGRNVLELFELSPGTINNHNPQFTRPQDNVAGDLYVNGNAVVSAPVQENIDGATNDNSGGYLGYPPPPDSVAEFKVVINPYDSSYGRAGGGAIDISLKSGTNKVHGDLYEYARRPYLDAQSYQFDYNASLPNQCPPLPAAQPSGCIPAGIPSRHKRDQFGLEVDGPVVIPHVYNGKDKTFFTFQWEQAYENLPSTSGTTSSIPNPDWLTGNFGSTATNPLGAEFEFTPASAAKNLRNLCPGVSKCPVPLGIFNPTSGVVTMTDPNDGSKKPAHAQFAGNNCGAIGVPITCMIPGTDPVGLAIGQYYKQITPNFNPGPGYAPYQNNYYFLPVEYDISRNFLAKIDQNFGPKDRATVRFEYYERYDTNQNNGIPTANLGNQESFQVQPKDNNYAIDEIHTFSPNFILDNKVTLLNGKQGLFSGSRNPNILSLLNMSQHYIQNAFYTNIFPSISVSNPFGLIGIGGGPAGYSISHNLAYQPSFTYIRGRHTIRGGLDMRLTQFANPGGGSSNQSLSYTNNFTQQYASNGDVTGYTSGSGYAAMILGDPNGAGIKYSIDVFYSQHYYAPWLQDDWKITPKLTLNLGVRYDLLTPRTERHNKLNYAFDTTDLSPVDAQLTTHAGLNGPLLGGITFAGVNGAPRGAYAINLLNIQPRFGAAYAVSSRTSLRAGFGEEFINNEDNDSSNGFSSSATGYNNVVNDGPGSPCGATTITGNTCPYGHASDPFPAYVQPTGSSLGLATTIGSSVNFKDPHYQVPSVWEYSVSLQQLLTRRDTLEIAYSGTRAYNLLDSLQLNNVSAAWNARCDVERTGYFGQPITQSARQNCDNSGTALCPGLPCAGPSQISNPFYKVPAFNGTGSYSTSSTISSGISTRAFPQFTGVSQDSSPFVHSWYNSLQVSASHNVSKSLTLHAAFSWSKAMKAGQVIDSVNGVFGRSISSNDTPIVVTFSSVFYLPVGRGKTFMPNANRVVDALVGGWEISPLYVYTEGKPWSPGNNWEYNSPIGIKAHDLQPDGTHAYKRLQGVTSCVAYKDTDTGAIINGKNYAAAGCTAPALVRVPNGYAINHNIVYWGVRTGAIHEFDASLSKHFAWNQRANLQLRLDAFNILNHPNWNNGFSSDPTSVDWGTFGKGPNGPGTPVRDLQISGKVSF